MNAKLYLTLGFVAFATAGFAQKPGQLVNRANYKLSSKVLQVAETKAAPAVKKTYDTGVYYDTPKGSLFRGFSYDGKAYSYSFLVVPPFTDLTFTNMSNNASRSSWSVNGNDASERVVNNNYVGNFLPMGFWYAPTVSVGRDSYTWGYYNEDGSVVATDSIADLAYFDLNTGARYGWGALEGKGKYLYGTGTVTLRDGKVYHSAGVTQYLEAPASPLYVNYISILAFSSGEPLKGDAQLTMTIYPANLVDTTYDENNPIVELTCTTNDTTFVHKGSSSNTTTHVANIYGMKFTNKQEDPILGITTDEPFVIDQPVAVVVRGVNDNGVDVGFPGHGYGNYDEETEERQQINGFLDFQEGGSVYYSETALELNFNGMMDYVNVDSTFASQQGDITGANILKVSDDGQTVSTYGKGSDQNLGCAIAWTALPWFDIDGNSNYSVEGAPDWVSEVSCDPQYWTQTEQGQSINYGQNLIAFKCQPLPAGVNGRAATVYLKGKGVKAATPIILLQGNADPAMSIAQYKADVESGKVKEIYDLAGRRVLPTTKGLVIKNGHVVLNK
ncbi:MAG: hypothetical protein ACOCN7_01740 [Prevotella sp.]